MSGCHTQARGLLCGGHSCESAGRGRPEGLSDASSRRLRSQGACGGGGGPGEKQGRHPGGSQAGAPGRLPAPAAGAGGLGGVSCASCLGHHPRLSLSPALITGPTWPCNKVRRVPRESRESIKSQGPLGARGKQGPDSRNLESLTGGGHTNNRADGLTRPDRPPRPLCCPGGWARAPPRSGGLIRNSPPPSSTHPLTEQVRRHRACLPGLVLGAAMSP